MAKTKSTKGKKNTAGKKITAKSLITAPSSLSMQADVGIVFKSGIGQVTASLFRKGILINMQSISSSGLIQFAQVQSGDAISVNGVCAGTADLSITVPTTPQTPEHFVAGIILAGYLIN